MREQMQSRLDTLRSELETGEAEYQQLQARETHLRETLLRISGAVQVLEELLSNEQRLGQDGANPAQAQPAVVDHPYSGEGPNDERTRGASHASG
jgi:hypothetical protein